MDDRARRPRRRRPDGSLRTLSRSDSTRASRLVASRLGKAPPLPLRSYLSRRRRALPFPLDDPGCALFARSRCGLFLGLRRLGISAGDELLVPAYNHGSEVEAIERAGVTCRFFEGDDRLEPDPDELERLLSERTRGLLLIHYLGFPQDAARWRRWCDERDLVLVEDAAQSWLATSGGRPVGSFGDLAFMSFYKTFGLPDGAAVLCGPNPPRATRRRTALRLLAMLHRASLEQRSAIVGSRAGGYEPAGGEELELDFELGDPEQGPSPATSFLLPRICDPRAAERRRANYAFLSEALAKHAPPPFDELSGGASPLVFVVEATDKERLLRDLDAQGITGMDVWPRPHRSIPAADFPRLAGRRATAVGLPLHQELSRRDLERVVQAAQYAFSRQ